QALNLLEAYIQFIIAKQQRDLLNNLAEQQSTDVKALGTRMKLMREDAERAFKNEINNLVLTISIAKAAGVERPLTNYSNGDR
ncbi:hypothetical protein ACFX56_27340, partial [Aeromonas hydrophila]